MLTINLRWVTMQDIYSEKYRLYRNTGITLNKKIIKNVIHNQEEKKRGGGGGGHGFCHKNHKYLI